ncbi:MAG TPA: cytochrome c [Bacteroides sp.]|nr:cytochrome c [Bacteroides sp.]
MRKMHHKKYTCQVFNLLILFVAGMMILSSCKKNPNHPGYVYLPDMDVSRAYETYSENPVFEDGKTLREPVEGTIPRGHTPYPYVKDDLDLMEAGKNIFNPLEPSEANIQQGEVLFTRFCSHCHGHQGDGKGILFTSGRFPLPPGDLTSEKTTNRPDGEIYHIVTVGYGIMSAHGSQILPEERWKIITYVRNVIQDSTVVN